MHGSVEQIGVPQEDHVGIVDAPNRFGAGQYPGVRHLTDVGIFS